MKPPPFDYAAPDSLDEVIALLSADEDAKIIAGGQSLMPLLALRLARPSMLVDLAHIGFDHVEFNDAEFDDAEFDHVGVDAADVGATVRIGALVRHRRLETDVAIARTVPLLADAAGQVGFVATRNRGTLGGSLAHADPVAELPAVAVALKARVIVTGPDGERELSGGELADGFFATTLSPDEVITEIRFPRASDRHGAAWCEWSPRAHDFAAAGVGVALDVDVDGTCIAVFAAGCGVDDRPLDLGPCLTSAGVLGATRPDASLLAAVADRVTALCPSAAGPNAELAGLLAARAVHVALNRAARNAGPVPSVTEMP